jgi:hypothetical protein
MDLQQQGLGHPGHPHDDELLQVSDLSPQVDDSRDITGLPWF